MSTLADLPVVAPAPQVKSAPKGDLFGQGMLLAVLFAAPALMCVHAANMNDNDIWWHLRTGEWMLQHHAVPQVDPFSGSNAGKPWAAYSWLFELLVTGLFQRFGLVGLLGYSAGMVLAIAVALRHLVARLQADFSLVAVLTFAGCFSLGHMFTPRPWLFTILFFVLEADILMHVRKTGRVRELFWLPVIFTLWANIHIQFIDGLVVLGLALGEAVVARFGVGTPVRSRVGWLLAALVGSVAATLANPFGWHIYRVAYDLAAQSGVMSKITELQAIPFRDQADFCLLFLALGAVGALAWTRKMPVFEWGLLGFAAVVSFRSQRDVWVMATAAVAVIAASINGRGKAENRLPVWATAVAVGLAWLAVLGGFRAMGVSNPMLREKVAQELPVNAVEAIRNKGYVGPLYNDFNWGGYLMLQLRMPVSVDGRAAFYGDAVLDRSVATWNGEPDWASDPQLKAAGLVVGPVKAPLTQLLRGDERFRLLYQDKVAAVFAARVSR
jgi:hypothetical protein